MIGTLVQPMLQRFDTELLAMHDVITHTADSTKSMDFQWNDLKIVQIKSVFKSILP